MGITKSLASLNKLTVRSALEPLSKPYVIEPVRFQLGENNGSGKEYFATSPRLDCLIYFISFNLVNREIICHVFIQSSDNYASHYIPSFSFGSARCG